MRCFAMFWLLAGRASISELRGSCFPGDQGLESCLLLSLENPSYLWFGADWDLLDVRIIPRHCLI